MKYRFHKNGQPFTKVDYEAYALKKRAEQLFLWGVAIDFLVIFLICATSRYAYFFLFFNTRYADYLFFSLTTAVIDAVIVFALFRLTMRHLRSVLWFFIGAFALPFAVFVWRRFDIVIHQKTIVEGSRVLYAGGIPTPDALVHDFTLYPYYAFMCIALVALVFDPFKEKAIKDMR